MYKKHEAIPKASLLLMSLRSVGYSEEAAIADIIDNSITAKATTIKIKFDWDGQRIMILDNGNGMSEEELFKNMQIGSSDPLNERATDDLGRFGMGMKTAAFSLGKKLTVVTREKDTFSNATWDLDAIEDIGWNLCVYDQTGYENEFAENQLGTLIVIEKLDRLIDAANLAKSKKAFYNMIERVKKHLALVFHRFITEDELRIYVNSDDYFVEAWDPFVLSNRATQELAEEEIWNDSYTHQTKIQPYVLPHKTKFPVAADYEDAAGSKGWNRHQGIYLYRNRRLIIYGTWFNLIKKEPAFNLARIRVDIESDADDEWKIDIKKSNASLPVYLQETLTRIVEDCTLRSEKVFNSRGAYNNGPSTPNLGFVWEQRRIHGKYTFRVNKKHALFSRIYGKLDNDGQQDMRAFISLLENFAPFMQSGVVDTISTKTNTSDDSFQKEKDMADIRNYIVRFRNAGFSDDEILATLSDMPEYRGLMPDIKKELGGSDD